MKKGKCRYCNTRFEAVNFTQLGLQAIAHKKAKHPEIVKKEAGFARRLSNEFLTRLRMS